MSHIHLPDGVLPWWVWLGAYILAALLLALISRGTLRQNARGFALLGIMAALMILVMTIEIGVYHVNLSVIAAIILGPAASVLAALIVNLFLAFLGHGGITVAGVNALVLTIEMLAGLGAFRGLRRLRAPVPAAVFLAVVIGLACGTAASYGVIVLNKPSIERVLAAEMHDHAGEAHAHELPGAEDGRINTRKLAGMMFGLGSIGWLIEAFISLALAGALRRLLPGVFDGCTAHVHEGSHGPVSH